MLPLLPNGEWAPLGGWGETRGQGAVSLVGLGARPQGLFLAAGIHLRGRVLAVPAASKLKTPVHPVSDV